MFRWRVEGVGLAADLGGQWRRDSETVGGTGGGGPVEVNVIADALDREVRGDGCEVKRGRAGRTGAGAGDEKRCKGREDARTDQACAPSPAGEGFRSFEQ